MNDIFLAIVSPGTLFVIKAIAAFISITAVTVIAVLVIQTQQLIHWRDLKEFREFFRIAEGPREVRGEKWKGIQARLESDNPADWKLAVIEADALMDDLLKRMGYEGQTMGERLKSIEPSDFHSLQLVWDAHKERNRIAHEMESAITQAEARRIVSWFEKGLEEFEYI